MLSQSFCVMESCVCSVRGDIGELAANPFSEHMQTFLFAFHSHCWHHLRLEGFLDEGGSNNSLLVVSHSLQAGWWRGNHKNIKMKPERGTLTKAQPWGCWFVPTSKLKCWFDSIAPAACVSQAIHQCWLSYQRMRGTVVASSLFCSQFITHTCHPPTHNELQTMVIERRLC